MICLSRYVESGASVGGREYLEGRSKERLQAEKKGEKWGRDTDKACKCEKTTG